MDKMTKYQNIIISFIEEQASQKLSMEGVENQILADKDRNHFQLVSVGWHKRQYYHHVVFHFDIKDGKIWIQRNDTEVMVADELIGRGVAREDIVLGFQPPYARPYTGFATA